MARGLALLALLTGLGCGAMLLLGRTNPWFIGALGVAVLLTANRVSLSAIPQPLVNAAQLVIGISLGVRFTREFVHLAPRWLGSVALASSAMLLLCAGFAWALRGCSQKWRACIGRRCWQLRPAASPRWRLPPRCCNSACRW